jgi:hypothetical protein
MRKYFIIFIITGKSVYAQQNTDRQSYFRDIRFNQYMEKITSGDKKLSFADIEGSPFYKSEFLPARFGNSGVVFPIRYNVITDVVEVLNGDNIYEIPKENIVKGSPLSKFTFEKSNETLILSDTHDELSGYYFSIVTGKNQLLKKITIEFKPEVPAQSHLIPAIPARFENPVAVYFIKTENDFIKVPKNIDEFLTHFSENENQLKDFIQKNNLKLNSEKDLIKLVGFHNAS